VNYTIKKVPRLSSWSGQAQRLIVAEHYSGTCPRAAQLFLLLDENRNPVGAAAITSGLPGMVKGFPPGTRVLSRFVLIPNLPKNSASWFLSRLPKLANAPVIISYADSAFHKGTIYKAAGWTFLGSSAPTMNWVKQGKLFTRKAGRITRTSAQMREFGATPLPPSKKLKFCWAQDKTSLPLSREAALARVVNWAREQLTPPEITNALSFL